MSDMYAYIVMYAAPIDRGAGVAVLNPGVFETKEEADYQAKQAVKSGVNAWVVTVSKGKFTKEQMKEVN